MQTILIILAIFGFALVLVRYPYTGIALLLLVPITKLAVVTHAPFFRSFDLTVFMNILVGVVGLSAYMRSSSGRLNVPWGLLACLVIIGLVFSVGLSWTTAPTYGGRKLFRFLGIGLPFLLLPALLIRSQKDALGLLNVLIFLSLVISVSVIFAPQSEIAAERYGVNYGRRTFFGSDPNTPAIVIVAGMLSLFAVFISSASKKLIKVAGLILFSLGLVALLFLGSRSSIVCLIIGLTLIPFFTKTRISSSVLMVGFLGGSILCCLYFVLPIFGIELPMNRWFEFSGQLKGGDISGNRAPAWMFIMANTWDNYIVFGHGPGSYAYDYLGVDETRYPHNIVLEALYEAGLVGCIAICAFINICVQTIRRGMRVSISAEQRMLVAALSSIFLSMVITALIHWDLDAARFLYLFAGILYASIIQIIDRNHCQSLYEQGVNASLHKAMN